MVFYTPVKIFHTYQGSGMVEEAGVPDKIHQPPTCHNFFHTRSCHERISNLGGDRRCGPQARFKPLDHRYPYQRDKMDVRKRDIDEKKWYNRFIIFVF